MENKQIGTIAGILIIILGGTVVYLEPTTQKDLCTLSGQSEMWQTTEIPNLYHCIPENTYKWCHKLSLVTKKTCYLYKEIDKEEAKTNISHKLFPKLIENKVSLGYGRSVFEFNNVFEEPISKDKILKLFPYGSEYVEGCSLKKQEIVFYDEPKKSYKDVEKCGIVNNITFVNETVCWNESVIDKEWIETKNKTEFVDFDYIPIGLSKIELYCNLTIILGERNIEWVTGVDIYDNKIERKEWAWLNSSFTKCQNITVTNVGSTTLTNFPAFINVTYDSDMMANYTDLRFANAGCNNGGSELDYEIENYTTDYALVWVEIDSLNSSGIILGMYYGYSGAETGDNPEGTWNPDFMMVQHLQETGTGTRFDSTKYGNNGTTSGYDGDEAIEGIIGGADDFDGTNDYINFGTDASISSTTGYFTLEAWVNYTATAANNEGVIDKYYDGSTRSYFMETRNDHVYGGVSTAGSDYDARLEGTTSLDDTAWHYIAVTFNGTYLKVYHNGNEDSSYEKSGTLWGNNQNLLMGLSWDSVYYTGTIDEARISNVSRTNDWLNQTYLMVTEQSTYAVFGAEEEEAVAAAPAWSANASTVISPYTGATSLSVFNVTWSEIPTSYNITHNFTGSNTTVAMTSLGSSKYGYEYTVPAGNFFWESAASNAVGLNTTDTWYFTVAKGNTTTNMVLTLDGDATATQTRNYSNATDVQSSNTNTGDATTNYTLLLDGSSASNGAITLAAGSYNYTYACDGGANWTAGQLERALTVNPIYLEGPYQWAQVTGYNFTYINYNITIVSYNNDTVTCSAITVTPDTDWGSAYTISSLATRAKNITYLGTVEIARGAADADYSIDAPTFSGNYSGTGNKLELINPIDPPSKAAPPTVKNIIPIWAKTILGSVKEIIKTGDET